MEGEQIASGFHIGKWIFKNIYWVILLLFLAPLLISTITTSISTHNPTYPFVKLGISIINSDKIIYDNVEILKTDPSKLLGINAGGFFGSLKYFFMVLKLFWNFLGLIFLITLPFVIFYKILNSVNSYQTGKNLFNSFLYGFIFIIMVNMFLTMYGFAMGTISIDKSLGVYAGIFEIIKLVLPFHGIVSLVFYLINIFK